jgi:hypothetical protein
VRWTALGLSIPAVLLCFAAGYYYVRFAHLIDARLAGERDTVLPRVFARPLELRRGQSLTDRQLVDRLNDLGYAQRAVPEKLGEFFGLYGLVGKGSQVIGQLLFVVIVLILQPSLGVGAYQVAVLSLLVTMLVGAWLIRPVSDQWSGSGELVAPVAPPERLAPATAPIEPR